MAEALEDAVDAVFKDNAELIRSYVRLLATAGVEQGLVGPAEADRLWQRHIFNSAALAGLIGQGATVFDVGSGAGLPGLPLALARPDLEVVLVEPLLRRCRFLDQVVGELGLGSRVRIVRARAEELRETADIVVARAVAPLGRLVAVTAPLFTGGALLALKGAKAEAEVTAAAPEIKRLGLQALLLWAQAHPAAEAARVVKVS
ncbi:MAG: 16S rRNA (guanine(527)-N(7))-methyltransferase RsmG [Propionibacteriaceae bacterium]|jgi:16S rRNA (guanine527-N7)-methyltransferase|nr:16S rRNA (guanine(527)-N(7))-methyltransferase RsmG [Propionibacteriaceae bacterium]